MMQSFRGPAGILLILSALNLAVLRGQDGGTPSSVYPDDSDAAESLLRSAAAFIKDKQWQEAAGVYQKIVAEFGDRVVKIPDSARSDEPFIGQTRRWFNLKQYVIAQLAALPPEAREAFGKTGEVQAGVLWSRANAAETSAQQRTADLDRLATEFYLSRYGRQAIELHGDLAFENGQFQLATSYYNQLARMPDEAAPPEGRLQLPAVYPDLQDRQPIVTAKLILASHAAGLLSESRRNAILKAFSAKWPEVAAPFAGRTGLLAASLIKAITDDKIYVAPAEDMNWPTFAGNYERNRMIADPIDIGARQWAVKIEPVLPPRTMVGRGGRFGVFGGGFAGRGAMNNPQLGRQSNPILAYHPVIVGEHVIYCTETRLVGYNLNEAAKPDGTVGPSWWQDLDKISPNRGQNNFFISGSPRMTLSAYGEKLYARFGESGNSMAFGNQFNNSNSIIAAFDLKNKGQLLWRVAGSKIPLKQPDGELAPELGSIEGSPVADADHVYVVLTLPGVQTSTYVAALSAANGEVEWTRYLFDIPNPFDMQAAAQGAVPGHAHHLLSMAGGNLYYQSDSGGVVSLDAETGRVRWATAYPRRDPNSTPLTRRDLNPVVYDNGTIYAAPSDSLQIHAIDAQNGAMKWISAPLPDVVHLVGVAQGNVLATGDRVWTIDAATGKILRSWPDSGVGYPASGRGLMAGNLLYWPTESEIHVIDAKNGLRSQKGSINLRDFQSQGGNLALGDGFLVIAGVDSLSVFTQNSRLIKRYQQLIAQNPDSALAHYRLATAAENLGESKLAIDAYRESVKRVKPTDRLDGQQVERLIRERFYHLLVRQASVEKDAEAALKLLREAATESADPIKKLAARMEIASLQMARGDTASSFEELVAIARDPVAGSQFWQPQGYYHVNLSAQARRRLLEAWQKMPANVKATIEQQNQAEISQRANAGKSDSLINFLQGVPPGPAEATGWLSALPNLDSAQRAEVIRHLEKQPSLPGEFAARIAKARAEQEALAAPEATKQAGAGIPRTVWAHESEVAGLAWLIGDINEQPMQDAMLARTAFLRTSSDGTVDLIKTSGNAVLGNFGAALRKPLWGGVVKGRGLVFDGQRLAGFDPLSGKVAWQLNLSSQAPGSTQNSPFAKPSSRPGQSTERAQERQESEDDWWMFQASGDRLMVQSVEGDCWRIDPVFGRLLWHRRTEPGDGATAILLGRHVLMRDGSSVILLDADSGAMERSIDGSIAGTQWIRRPIAWDDDRVLMTADRMQVIMLDLKSGQVAWRWKASEIQPTNGPPRYFRHGEMLVAIADGKTMVRLDPKNGQVLWTIALGGYDYSLEYRDVAVDDQFVYLMQQLDPKSVPGVVVTAYHLTDGSQAWSRRVIGSAVSWAIELVKSQSGKQLWIYPDCETSRRLVTGQAMTAQPGEWGENQGNASSGLSSAVVELDPASGRMIRRVVSRVSDSANWVMPDWASGKLLWVSSKGSRQIFIDLLSDRGQKALGLSPK